MPFVGEQSAIDGAKCINGRKCSIAVDRLGLPFSLAVTSANTSDSEAGRLVLDRLKGKAPRLQVIAADAGFKMSFIGYAQQNKRLAGRNGADRTSGYSTRTRISQGLYTRKELLARLTQLCLAYFPAAFVSQLGENHRKFGGYAPDRLHFLSP